jgi:predicted ATP-binding protein involved in virulence
MYIDRIEVDNLRCFAKTSVAFRRPDEKDSSRSPIANVTLLLGNNGTGKSTLLRAIALAALARVIQSSGYVPFSMIRRIASSRKGTAGKPPSKALTRGVFQLHAQDGNGRKAPTSGLVTTSVQITRRGTGEVVEAQQKRARYWEKIFHDDSPSFLVLGYGATRRVEPDETVDLSARQKSRRLRYRRVAGLFEEQFTMVPLNAWLPDLQTRNKGRYSQVIWLLNRLLPDDTNFQGKREDGHYVFERRGVQVAFEAMSDGYRQYIGWISDLLYHVCMGCPSGKTLAENTGIVLIDEIDLHLHPEWQRTVIPLLAKTLPHLQFILTTHSPILVGTLHRQNVVVLDSDDSGTTATTQVATEIYGLNADQVLTSSAFGLASTRAPEFLTRLRTESNRAQKGDRVAQRMFHKLMVYGAGADEIAGSIVRAPAVAKAAAKRLQKLASISDLAARSSATHSSKVNRVKKKRRT